MANSLTQNSFKFSRPFQMTRGLNSSSLCSPMISVLEHWHNIWAYRRQRS